MERIFGLAPRLARCKLAKSLGRGRRGPQSANALWDISAIGGVVRGVNLHDETIIHSRCCLLFGNRIRSERAAQTR